MNSNIRLILDPPRSATLNMAIDEYLMESQADLESLPTLRIYSWEEPACSIGYFQGVNDVARRLDSLYQKMIVVKRITGGGLVMHGEDLTFSLALKDPGPFLPKDAKSSYLKVNEALLAGLREIFPTLDFVDCKSLPFGRGQNARICFESPSCYDLQLEGKKVAGASQRRKKGVLLHQSAIFLESSKENLIHSILKGFEKKWQVDFEEIPLSDQELALATELESTRYSSPAWAYPERSRRAYSST